MGLSAMVEAASAARWHLVESLIARVGRETKPPGERGGLKIIKRRNVAWNIYSMTKCDGVQRNTHDAVREWRWSSSAPD